jgi:hypothetical protein
MRLLTMLRGFTRESGALALAFLAVACAGPSDPDRLVEPIHVDSVDVLVGTGEPASVDAHVQGVIGDGCSTLHSTTQARSGSTVTISIMRERPADAICTQIALLYDDRIRLEGTFARGSYVLRVNGVERPFSVPAP